MFMHQASETVMFCVVLLVFFGLFQDLKHLLFDMGHILHMHILLRYKDKSLLVRIIV